MKKKLLAVLVGAALVLGVAGHGSAYFEDNKLIMTINDWTKDETNALTNPMEIAKDLGAAATSYGNNIYLGAVSKGSLGSYSNLTLSYYAFNDATLSSADYWVMGSALAPVMASRKGSGDQTNSGKLQGYYAGLTGQTVTANMANANSWYGTFQGNGTGMALFNNSLSSNAAASISLAGLATGDHTITTYLYFIDYNNIQSGSATGVRVATIKTWAEAGDDTIFGTSDDLIKTTINPSAVPVPASLLLFAPGLLGLIGLRRRNAK